MPVDIMPEHYALVTHILKCHLPPTAMVWVFGSRAKGTARPYSDLDLLIDAGQPLSLSVRANLAYDFDESNLPYKVDIVDNATIDNAFRTTIEAERVIF